MFSPIDDCGVVEIEVEVEVEVEVELEEPSGDNFKFWIASILKYFGIFSTCCTVHVKRRKMTQWNKEKNLTRKCKTIVINVITVNVKNN